MPGKDQTKRERHINKADSYKVWQRAHPFPHWYESAGGGEDAYRPRIAELQAGYRLVASSGPVTYHCREEPSKEIVVTFFATAPPTLIARCGGEKSLRYNQPSGSGSRYQGRNVSLWEHHGDARITWGYGSREWHCTTSAAGNKQE